MSSLFLGNSRHCMQWVRKYLTIAKAHMCLGTLQGAVASVALVPGVHPVCQ